MPDEHAWGTELELVVEGLEPGTPYTVTFFDAGGASYAAGEFLGVGDRPVVCDMNAALLREDAVCLQVPGPDGVVLAARL